MSGTVRAFLPQSFRAAPGRAPRAPLAQINLADVLQNLLLTLDCTPECILTLCRAFTTAGNPPFRLANSQSALISVSMPFGSMSGASSCHQPPAAQAAFAFTPATPSNAYALCDECRLWVFRCKRLRS